MNKLFKLLIPLSILTMSGCVVAPYGPYAYYHPYGYYRGYYGPRVWVVAPVVVVRP